MLLHHKIILGLIIAAAVIAIWHTIGEQNKPGRPTGGNLPPREADDGQDEP